METQAESKATPPAAYPSSPVDLVKLSWAAFKVAWLPFLKLICVAIVVLGLVIGLTVGIIMVFKDSAAGLVVPLALLGFAGLIILGTYLGWMSTRVFLEASRGHRIGLKESRPETFGHIWPLLGTNFLALVIILVGFVLLIIPGLIFMTWYAFASVVVVDERLSGWAALKRSKELVKGRFWEVVALYVLPSCAFIVTIVPVLGDIVYLAITLILMPIAFIRYLTFREFQNTSFPVEKTPGSY
jgi:hypothetical protein